MSAACSHVGGIGECFVTDSYPYGVSVRRYSSIGGILSGSEYRFWVYFALPLMDEYISPFLLCACLVFAVSYLTFDSDGKSYYPFIANPSSFAAHVLGGHACSHSEVSGSSLSIRRSLVLFLTLRVTYPTTPPQSLLGGICYFGYLFIPFLLLFMFIVSGLSVASSGHPLHGQIT